MMNICVFGSSSSKLEPSFYETARALGRAIGKAGAGMVFGAGGAGLMGAAAEGAHETGGSIIGVIPEKLHGWGVAYPLCTKLIVTPTMHERKAQMEALSAAFIALPGGFGTLEELLEVITLKQLGYHNHPIIVLNQDGFYDPMLEQFRVLYETGFAHPGFEALYLVAKTPLEAVTLAMESIPVSLPDKLTDAKSERSEGA